MKPYYHDEKAGITIYHGDAREVLPTLIERPDLTVMDPPYGMEYESGRYVNGNPHGPIHGDDAYPLDVLEACLKFTRRAVLTFCRWDTLSTLPLPKSFIVWAKNNWTSGDLEHGYGRQWEGIAFYPREEHEWGNGRPTDIIDWRKVDSTKLLHPTEKPVGLMGQLLQHHRGHLVLDPFCGSGSTLVAAKELGRRAVGIEIDEAHCYTASRRLAQEVLF